jgi:hypothetical protein
MLNTLCLQRGLFSIKNLNELYIRVFKGIRHEKDSTSKRVRDPESPAKSIAQKSHDLKTVFPNGVKGKQGIV